MNGKHLLLIGIILSVLILCLPVFATEYDYSVTGASNGAIFLYPMFYNTSIMDLQEVDSLTFSSDNLLVWEDDGSGSETISISCWDATPIGTATVSWNMPAGGWETYANFGSGTITWDNFNLNASSCADHVVFPAPAGKEFLSFASWGTGYQDNLYYIIPYNGGKGSGIGDYVLLYGEPPAYTIDFTSDKTEGLIPLQVLFTDASTGFSPIGNYWDFGDGYTYNPQNFESSISHTYINDGYYDIKYAVWGTGLSPFGWENKTAYINAQATTGNTTSGFNIYVNPTTVNYNENFTITSTSNTGFGGITNIKFGYTKGTENNILDSADGNILDYVNTSGTWYQFNVDTHSYDIALSGVPSSIINIPAKMGSGTYTIDGYITKINNQVVHVTDELIITTDNQQTLTIQAIDYNDGYIVSTAHINVNDIASGIWDNRSVGGEKIFYYPYGQKLYIDVNSSSYYTSSKNYTVTSTPTNTVQVIMYRGINTPAGNVTLRVNVMDSLGGYLNNAKVTVLNDESYFESQSKYTNYAGVATFTILPDTDYAISVSKTGYLSAGKLINSGTGGLTLDTTITLNVGTNPTATPTPLPTTAAGQYTGNIGGSNLTPVTCKTVLPQGSTLLDTLRNNMACAGITSGQNQGFGIALMIIFTLGIIGGKYGKGMGVVMGMSAGYVLSLAMNLVPLWTFIALLVFICLILAIKIWSSEK